MSSGEKANNRFEGHLLPAMDALYQSAFAYAGNPNDAEDLVQEAVLKACRRYQAKRPKPLRFWALLGWATQVCAPGVGPIGGTHAPRKMSPACTGQHAPASGVLTLSPRPEGADVTAKPDRRVSGGAEGQLQ